MKKYVVPIAGWDIDLSRIKFSEPLSCEIDNNKNVKKIYLHL